MIAIDLRFRVTHFHVSKYCRSDFHKLILFVKDMYQQGVLVSKITHIIRALICVITAICKLGILRSNRQE